jgi:dipeptidyl aminopeptidase/acylaminoacyl peptidase
MAIIRVCILMIVVSVSCGKFAQTDDKYELHKLKQMEIENVKSFAWSPDGTRLAVVANPSPSIYILDKVTWEIQLTIPDVYINHVAWSPDGALLASVRGGSSETLLIWDAATGEIVSQITRRPLRTDGVLIIDRLSWSPDGTVIASNSAFDAILIWDLDDESVAPLLQEPIYHGTQEIRWTTAGDKILTGGTDDTLRVWDINFPENQIVVSGYKTITWRPDGARFAGANFDHILSIWDTITGENIANLRGHTNNILSVDWHPTDDFVVSSSLDQTIKIWDVTTGEAIITIPENTGLVAWSPAGNLLATISLGKLTIWSFQSY